MLRSIVQFFVPGANYMGAMYFLMFFAMMSMGAVAGGNAATVDNTTREDVHSNLTTAESQIEANFTSIEDDMSRTMVLTMYGPVETAGFPATHWAVDFGYEHPRMADLWGKVSPVVLLGGLWVMIWKQMRAAWRAVG